MADLERNIAPNEGAVDETTEDLSADVAEMIAEGPEWMKTTKTLYVGHLPAHTTQSQLHRIFSRAGPIKDIHMGTFRETNEPAGFCFIEFCSRDGLMEAFEHLRGVKVESSYAFLLLDEGVSPVRLQCSLGQRDADGIYRPPKRQPRRSQGKSADGSKRATATKNGAVLPGNLAAVAEQLASGPRKRAHEN